jgi:hypothetical protein
MGTPLECHRKIMMDECVWSMDILKASTLEPKNGGLVNGHESLLLEELLDPLLAVVIWIIDHHILGIN